MSIIKRPVLYVGCKGEQHLYSLFDSGAELSCIHPEFVERLGIPVPLPRRTRVATASEGSYVEISEVIRLEFYVNDILLSDEFMVVPGLTEEVILGAATLQKWRIKLDFEHDTVHVSPRAAEMKLGKLWIDGFLD